MYRHDDDDDDDAGRKKSGLIKSILIAALAWPFAAERSFVVASIALGLVEYSSARIG
jgi:hypothetical protein